MPACTHVRQSNVNPHRDRYWPRDTHRCFSYSNAESSARSETLWPCTDSQMILQSGMNGSTVKFTSDPSLEAAKCCAPPALSKSKVFETEQVSVVKHFRFTPSLLPPKTIDSTSKALWMMSTPSVTGWQPMLKAAGLSLIILAANKHLEHRYWDKAWKTFEEGLPQQFPWTEKGPDEGDDNSKSAKSFYFDELPRDLAIQLMLFLANYQWQCLLERWLPTRPQGSNFTAQEKAKVTDDDDMMEDEVMRRLIAKGKVRRASISWCNVFLKWLINNTITFSVIALAYHVIDEVSHLRSPLQIWKDLLLVCISNFFSEISLSEIHRVPSSRWWFIGSPLRRLFRLSVSQSSPFNTDCPLSRA